MGGFKGPEGGQHDPQKHKVRNVSRSKFGRAMTNLSGPFRPTHFSQCNGFVGWLHLVRDGLGNTENEFENDLTI
jgi:hypothetical protein